MSIVWILLALKIAALGMLRAAVRLRRAREADLGTVSHQWMAEQRLGREYEAQR